MPFHKNGEKVKYSQITTLNRQCYDNNVLVHRNCLFIRVYPMEIIIKKDQFNDPEHRYQRHTFCSIEYSEAEMEAFLNSYNLRQYYAVISTGYRHYGRHCDDHTPHSGVFMEQSIVDENNWTNRVGEYCQSEHEILHYYALFTIEEIYFSLAYQNDYLHIYNDGYDELEFRFADYPFPLKRVLVRIILLFQKYSLERFKVRWIIFHRRKKLLDVLREVCSYDSFILRLPHDLLRDHILPYFY